MSKICIIGCGNIGYSMAQGFVNSADFDNQSLSVTGRKGKPLSNLKDLDVKVTNDNIYAIAGAEIVIIAVKPHDFNSVIREIAPHIQDKILVSVVAGLSIKQIKKDVPSSVQVFRAMPNTASKFGETITCLCSDSIDQPSFEKVEKLFRSIGRTIIIQEDLMDAATVLGACGVAYVMRFIRAMVQGGIQIGFSSEDAKTIVTQTVKGAAELLLEGGMHPEAEIDKVTTPKGCTIVGLNEMEHNGFSSALIKGLIESYKEINSGKIN